jgi:hypothetical protein
MNKPVESGTTGNSDDGAIPLCEVTCGAPSEFTKAELATAPENGDVAFQILYYGIGGDLSDINTSKPEVRKEWAGILNRDPSEVRLRRW